MSLTLLDLAPELLSQIYQNLHTVSDVMSLSLTSHHLNRTLRHSQRLPTLFAAAEREFGPLTEITQLVTFNYSQSAHTRRAPQLSYPLLRQCIKIGEVANKILDLYPQRRWDGETQWLERRALTEDEKWRLRRACYRYWLYCEAFQGRSWTRGMRCLPGLVEERAQLLRTWSTEELIEIEDLRLVLEEIVSTDICPTDGSAQREFHSNCDFSDVRYSHRVPYMQKSWNSWPPDTYTSMNPLLTSHLFYNHREEQLAKQFLDVPVPQRRKLEMTGWGDEISQYYVVQSMMKLNPAQILYLYDHCSRKQEVEGWISETLGEEWFWDNGQTWLDTWSLVLCRRGDNLAIVKDKLLLGEIGITSEKNLDWIGEAEQESDICL